MQTECRILIFQLDKSLHVLVVSSQKDNSCLYSIRVDTGQSEQVYQVPGEVYSSPLLVSQAPVRRPSSILMEVINMVMLSIHQ